jgi:hypothetical protein
MTFKGQIDEWILMSEELTGAVVKEASQELAIAANNPVGNGGRMRVDTGFLRNSIVASLNQIPSGPDVKPDNYSKIGWEPTEVATTINRMKPDDTLYIGWSAEYAAYRENQDFFARTAAQNWSKYVDDAVLRLEMRFNA